MLGKLKVKRLILKSLKAFLRAGPKSNYLSFCV